MPLSEIFCFIGAIKNITSEFVHRVGLRGADYILSCLGGIYFEATKGSRRASEAWPHMEELESLYRGWQRSTGKGSASFTRTMRHLARTAVIVEWSPPKATI